MWRTIVIAMLIGLLVRTQCQEAQPPPLPFSDKLPAPAELEQHGVHGAMNHPLGHRFKRGQQKRQHVGTEHAHPSINAIDTQTAEGQIARPRRQQDTRVGALHDAKVLIFTALSPEPCKKPGGGFFNTLSIKNKQDYAEMHGYSFQWFTEHTDPAFYGPWNKMVLLRNLLNIYKDTEVEWFMWVDSDTLFAQMNLSIPFDRYDAHDMVLISYRNGEPISQMNAQSLNSGVILVKNTDWSRNFVNKVCYYGEGWGHYGDSERAKEVIAGTGPDASPHYFDQSAIPYVLRNNPQWEPNVYFEEGVGDFVFHTQYRWSEGFDQMSLNPGPLLIHYAGCQFCSYASAGSFVVEQDGGCSHHFFAIYGYARNLTEEHSVGAMWKISMPFDVKGSMEKLAEQSERVRGYMATDAYSRWTNYYQDLETRSTQQQETRRRNLLDGAGSLEFWKKVTSALRRGRSYNG